MRKHITFFTSFFILSFFSGLTSNASTANNQSVAVSDCQSLEDAINFAPTDGSEYVIEINAPINLNETITIPTGTNIKMTATYNITLYTSGRRHFIMSPASTLTFENIYLYGENTGGGIVIKGDAKLNGAKFRFCYSQNGGAIESQGGSVILKDITVEASSAINGGGVYIGSDTKSLTMINSKFTSNSAVTGGAICCIGTTIIDNCDITQNTGSGIHSNGELSITNSRITNNESDHGGGIYNDIGSSMNISNSTISENSATYMGGGIMVYGTQNLISVNDCIITNNHASSGGGIWTRFHDDLEISADTIFDGNSADYGYKPHQGIVNKYPNIASFSASGNYRYPINNYDINYTDAPKIISISIPVKMMWAAFAEDKGQIKSPFYYIKNDTIDDYEVSVNISPTDYDSTIIGGNVELLLDSDDTAITKDDSGTAASYNAELAYNSSMHMFFTGIYTGSFSNTYYPEYDAVFKIQIKD